MARFMEYQGKDVLKKMGIKIPKGSIAESPDDARKFASELDASVVLKAQVLSGKRGKKGFIKYANSPDEAKEKANEMLSQKVEGEPIKRLLVEEKIKIDKELYLGVTSNDNTRAPVAIFSLSGGMDIEEVGIGNPEKILEKDISISDGFQQYDALNLIRKSKNLSNEEIVGYGRVLSVLYDIYRSYDCKLVEINPLVLSGNNIIALDARIDIDDDAIFRHPELGLEHSEEAGSREPTPLEFAAGQIDKNDHRGSAHFVQIDPGAMRAKKDNKIPIAYHCVGAGCAITLFDEISPLGYSPIDFCDTSGNPPAIKLYAAAKIIMSQPQIKGYLFCTGMAAQLLDNTARGLIKAFKELYPENGGKPNIPCIFCFRGRADDDALKLFNEHGISESRWVKVLDRYNTERDVAVEFDRLYKKWIKEIGGLPNA